MTKSSPRPRSSISGLAGSSADLVQLTRDCLILLSMMRLDVGGLR